MIFNSWKEKKQQRFDPWLDAGLWPDGPTTPLQHIVTISGSPRSGTTWFHNALIKSGRFKGIPGDDRVPIGSDLFVTDENRYVHIGLVQTLLPDANEQSSISLQSLLRMIYLRFGRGGELMLKSPYYAFFIDPLAKCGTSVSFIFMRRELDSTALSMLHHPHLGRLLHSSVYEQSYDVIGGGTNYEAAHVEPETAHYFIKNYKRLTPFDRALFKAHTFSSSFKNGAKHRAPEQIFIVDYDKFAGDKISQLALEKFLHLTPGQTRTIVESFRPPRHSGRDLPLHDTGFRREVLEADRRLWERVGPQEVSSL